MSFKNLLSRNNLIFIPAILLVCSGPVIYGQEVPEDELPSPVLVDNDLESGKKSAEAVNGSWNALANGSDYYIYFTWSGITGSCPCSNVTTYIAFKNNGTEVTRKNSPASSYSGSGVYYGIGPSQTGKFTMAAPYTGKTYVISPSFDCWYACSGTISSSGTLTRTTYSLKAPVNVSASDKKSDNSVVITWGKGTHVPNDKHSYIIYRNGAQIGTVQGTQTLSFTDTGLEPGQSYSYSVATHASTWSKTSSSVYTTGYTFHLNPVASADLRTSIDLSWNSTANLISPASSFIIERQEPSGTWVELGSTSGSSTGYKDDSQGLIPGYTYTYRISPQPTDKFHSYTCQGKKLGNGVIEGSVTAPMGGGVDSVLITVQRKSNTIPQHELNPESYSAFTNPDGSYNVNFIYYYEEDTFLVTPFKEDHGFKPSEKSVILTLDDFSETGINFIDTTSFSLSGTISLNDGKCPAAGVEIWLDDLNSGILTDADGNYSITVPRIGDYKIEPKQAGHGFDPSVLNMNIADNMNNVNFDDTTMYTLYGYVKASCDYYIGQADVRIFSTSSLGCLDTTITTEEGTGYYSIKLPAQDYNIELTSFTTVDEYLVTNAEVLEYFSVRNTSLVSGDQEMDFILRRPPVMTVTGLEIYGCNDYEGIPIVQQNHEYLITFHANESISDASCPADTGFVIVYNGLVDGAMQQDTVWLVDGKADYLLVPGEPDIIAPHLKLLEAELNVMGEKDNYSQNFLVTGNNPRDNTFTTVSPQVPLMILHDPPGDGSYSYIEEGTTTELGMKMMLQASGSVNTWAAAKLGVAFSAGEGVSIEHATWGTIGGNLEVGASVSAEQEFNMTITNTEAFSTSSSPDAIGDDGDLFVGAAMNIIYALTDIIEWDEANCSVKKYADIIMGVDGFDTEFIYTQSHIKNVLIPQLSQLRDIYLSEDSDSAKIYQDQISCWQQVLDENQKNKDGAVLEENRSFSGNTITEISHEVTKSSRSTVEMTLYIEAGVAIEAGTETAGSGISGGVAIKVRVETGVSATVGFNKSRKTGFVLTDDDEGDSFTLNILADPVHGTPAFQLVGGRSSCPWEEGTQAREGVQLLTDSYSQNVEDPEDQAVFRLSLGNVSQSDEDFIYNLTFLQASNPDGAVLTLGGSQVQGGVPTPYYVPAGASKEATITVERGPVAYDYNNLMFTMTSGCEDENIADTVSLDVHFTSPCSDLILSKPYNNWVVNSKRSSLPVKLEGYDLALLEMLKFQYAPANTNDWLTDFTVAPSEMGDELTELEWSFAHLKDGKYDLRVALDCSNGGNYSEVLSGIIDRHGPGLFGIPEPHDLVLDSGEFILVSFDEDINCDLLSPENVSITNINTGSQLDFATGCSGNTLIFVPELQGAEFVNDTFMVMVTGVSDYYGNTSSDTIEWSFTVPDPDNLVVGENEDSDIDGILNKDDNCPFTPNPEQYDMDNDKKGDKCDEDMDGDGIPNIVDNCLTGYNPDQEDINNDGIGDECQDLTGINPNTLPVGFELLENYPNPFLDYTTISFVIPERSEVTIRIYDARGTLIRILTNREYPDGRHDLDLNSESMASGLYFYSIDARSSETEKIFRKTMKMTLVK